MRGNGVRAVFTLSDSHLESVACQNIIRAYKQSMAYHACTQVDELKELVIGKSLQSGATVVVQLGEDVED